MIRKILFAATVLGAVVFWANCSYNPPVATPQEPDWNTFFAGCFEGEIVDPPGKLQIILEAGASDEFTLSGCLTASLGDGEQTATFAGTVQADRQRAELMATSNLGGEYVIAVERQPAGEVVANTVTVTNVTNAPFNNAPNLTRCTATCPSMSVRLPFMPDGGPP
ncbi:MAG TPA: hypothetical protein VGB99_02465 [Acidobacteriota bacterium]